MVGRPVRVKSEHTAAPELPVARVALMVPLAHLDRDFDYLVDAAQSDDAQPGVRVRVRFAGRLVDGFVLERAASSAHTGKLGWLEKVVSPEQVLTPEIAALARTVAGRYAGTRSDVLRLAVPARHARVETDAAPPVQGCPPAPPEAPAWAAYTHGERYLVALGQERSPRAVWQALPGEDWPARIAEAVAWTVSAGRTALVIVPDQGDVDRVHAACVGALDADTVVELTAALGPSARYRRWLAALRGTARVVVGTRAAVFAPLRNLGLVVVWDDGDDTHAELRAPYPHAREVALLRAHADHAGVLLGGFSRTAEGQLLVETGWAHDLLAPREVLRERSPRITAVADTDVQLERDPGARASRLPAVAFAAARAALAADAPVLVQVPRRGYVPSLGCARCREPARCRRCAGPLSLPAAAGPDGAATPVCRWCGVADAAFRCAACGSRALRARVVGAGRTAEELGRAFPGVPVRTSGGSSVLTEVPRGPAVVVATPGAEPVVPGGYGAALLLDGWALLGRADLRAAEETLRRWMAAAALVRPIGQGGQVVVGAESELPTVQALVRWDPVGHAATELHSRAEVGFPPAVHLAAVEGPPKAVAALVEAVEQPEGTQLLGPVDIDDGGERMLLRVPREQGKALSAALSAAQAARSARKDAESVRVQVDPHRIG
ncbi:primosomal protein N' [Rhodococcus sp. X156]|uniref:primosomal protein N' n=1 Tax=Rhodococcus sp. X156 TaxID=2499145 RepID=UPI000FD7B3BC|nr:primosomal protein N' [Rhodococcus sp. X156]